MLIKIINHPRKQAIILTFTAINTEPAGAREREEIILDVVREEEETPGNTRDTACQVKVNFVFTNFCQETSLMF